MQITRLDLDGKGSGSPEGLVALILKAQPLSIPVPIEELALALDIKEIAELETEGFEGGLLMDQYRREGIILVNKSSGLGRRRFTVGHELAHFLIPTHTPIKADRFLCSREDMSTWTAGEQNRYGRMEVEANRFSALILMPPPLLRPYLARRGDPSVTGVLAVSEDFAVSKDAAARAYAQHHDDPVAITLVKDGRVMRTYRNSRFPKLSVAQGDAVPKPSLFHQSVASDTELSEVKEVAGGQWLESDWGKPLPQLCEQVLLQGHGYALILLWAELPEEDDDDDREAGMTAKQRLAQRRGRWQDN